MPYTNYQKPQIGGSEWRSVSGATQYFGLTNEVPGPRLNGGAGYVIPSLDALIYVVRVQRVHVIRLWIPDDTMSYRVEKMMCGLELHVAHAETVTMKMWADLIIQARLHQNLPRIRRQDTPSYGCLDCDAAFNQSEIAC